MPDLAIPKTRVAVLISGKGTNMAALLYASRLPDCPYEIVLVASNDPAAEGLALAQAEGLATFALDHRGLAREAHDERMDTAIRQARAEFVALAGYMRILSDGMVAKWQGRMLNIHPSLLPKYPGLDTHARAIAAQDTRAGATVHLVSPKLDSGEPLGQVEVVIRPGEAPQTLAERVRLAEHQLYPRVLAEYVSRPYDRDWLLGQVRQRALILPEAEERPSHGAPGWRTGGKSGKYFAYFSDQHHGEDHVALLVKTSGPEELAELVERDPEAFYKPAYYGASGWVGVILNRPGCDWPQVEYWLERSWRSVAPKRLSGLMNASDEF